MAGHILALSTCWRSADVRDAEELLQVLEPTGIKRLELEYRISTPLWNELRPELKTRNYTVVSLHNFFPLPPRYSPDEASGDLFNLASDDAEERKQAIECTIKTLENACDLETDRIVIHSGYVNGLEPIDKDCLNLLCRGDEEAGKTFSRYLEERAKSAPRSVDLLKFSLEKCLKRADALGVSIGIENRDRPNEIPDMNETAELLREFKGGCIGPWLDVGHAAKSELYGLYPVDTWIDRFGSAFLGIHLHDAEGLEDHRPPGKGVLDLAHIIERVADIDVWVLEINTRHSLQEITEGLAYLNRLLEESPKNKENKRKIKRD